MRSTKINLKEIVLNLLLFCGKSDSIIVSK